MYNLAKMTLKELLAVWDVLFNGNLQINKSSSFYLARK